MTFADGLASTAAVAFRKATDMGNTGFLNRQMEETGSLKPSRTRTNALVRQ